MTKIVKIKTVGTDCGISTCVRLFFKNQLGDLRAITNIAVSFSNYREIKAFREIVPELREGLATVKGLHELKRNLSVDISERLRVFARETQDHLLLDNSRPNDQMRRMVQILFEDFASHKEYQKNFQRLGSCKWS